MEHSARVSGGTQRAFCFSLHSVIPNIACTQRVNVMDAHRISDSLPVMLKVVPSESGPYSQEREIAHLFSSSPLSEDPRNHCLPVLDVLELPQDSELAGGKEMRIIVMRRLIRIDRPRFDTVGEVVALFREIFEVTASPSLMPKA